MIAGANAYGKDKLSFNDRIKWVYNNKKAILS
jgi:DNA-directed RNA polymerase